MTDSQAADVEGEGFWGMLGSLVLSVVSLVCDMYTRTDNIGWYNAGFYCGAAAECSMILPW